MKKSVVLFLVLGLIAPALRAQSNTTLTQDSSTPLTASNPLTLNVGSTDIVVQSGVISGTGTLTKAGTGTLILTAANTFLSGAPGQFATTTTISGGILQIGNGGGTGSIAGNIEDNAAIVFNRSGFLTVTKNITGSGTLTQAGPGTLTLSGPGSTYFGGTIISGGTLALGTNLGLPFHGPVTINGGTLDLGTFNATIGTLSLSSGSITGTGTLTGSSSFAFSNGSATTISVPLSTAGTLAKSGAGRLTLSAANTFTGGLTLTDGTLALDHAAAIGSAGTINFGGGTLQFTANNTTDYSTRFSSAAGQAYNFDTNSQTVTLAGALTSSGGTLTKSGSGTLVLSGANTYDGGTTISGGVLQLNSSGALGSTGTIAFNGGALQFTANNATDYSARFSNAVSQAYKLDTNGQDVTLASALTSSGGSLTKTGAGTLILTGDSSFSGSTTVSTGTLQIGNAGTSGSVAGGIVDNAALVFNRSDAVIYSGVISGAGTLTQSGAGTLILTGANSLTGGTTISSGALQIGNAGTTGSLAGAVVDNGSLVFNRTNAFTFSGAISGSGSVTQSGTATVALTGANSFTGGLTLAAGLLQVGSSGALGTTGPITFGGGTLVFTASNTSDYSARFNPAAGQIYKINTNSQDVTFASALTSAGGTLTKSGAGTLILTGANSYSGGTTVSTGVLQIGSGGTAGSVAGNVTDNASLVFNRSDAITFSGAISGSGSLIQSGASTLILTGANSFTGVTTISSGVLQIGNAGTTGSLSGAVVNNSSLVFNRSDAATFSGAISGTGSLTQSGTGPLTLNGASSYSGGSQLANGSTVLGNATALGTGTVQLAGGMLQASSPVTIANALSLSADTTIGGNAALTISGPLTLTHNRDLTVSNTALTTITGAIGESGGGRGLNKYGTGELDLTGASTYSGGTFIGEGTVRINNVTGSAFGTGAVTVASGATLVGAGRFTGAFQNNGLYSPGNSPALVTDSAFFQSSTGTLIMELGGLTRGSQYDALDITGSFAPGGTLSVVLYGGFNPTTGATFDLFNWGAITGTFDHVTLPGLASGLSWDDSALYTMGVFNVIASGGGSAIPEPSTYAAIFGASAIGFAMWRRRKLQP